MVTARCCLTAASSAGMVRSAACGHAHCLCTWPANSECPGGGGLNESQYQALHSPIDLWSPGRQVSLHCGVEEALANVSEPNRCEYVARLVTPAACTPELVALARREYEEAERELAAVHDEL